jgi:Family of unknown function (DUF6455)
VIAGGGASIPMGDRDRQRTYMSERMEHLGIEPAGGVISRLALSYATAFGRCQACKSRQACREWLDRRPAAGGFAPSFCPNADIFLNCNSIGRCQKAPLNTALIAVLLKTSNRATLVERII